jgi:glyoxylase-like metal-dependent hydrolase (beta-lactamase superfamily II)
VLDPTLQMLWPGVWRLVAPNPSLMTGPGTNTYLIGGRTTIILDPGPADPTHRDAIARALEQLGATPRLIVVSHRHSDHSSGAIPLGRRLGVPLAAYEAGLGASSDYARPLLDGSELAVEGFTLLARYTPGHCDDHLCFWLKEHRLLFAADLVAGAGTILITPPDGDMAAYLNSLQAMLALDLEAILPGHGPVIDTPREKLQEYIDHRLRRERQVIDCLGRGFSSAREIARQIYAGEPPSVLPLATMQIEAHLAKLTREGKLDKWQRASRQQARR